MKHLFILVALVLSLSACARSLSVAQLQHNPARYIDRTVSVSGVVTSSWGIPLVPFKLYKVDDGTGEVTVVSQNERIPPRGTRVRVKGRVADVAVLGGRSLGLHIKEESLDVRGW
jgi:hypothetical protein